MRIRRSTLVDQSRGQYFHVVSRVVDRRFILGDQEKDFFLRILRQYEGFSGVEVLSYCLMSNHFHLLVHIPAKPDNIPESEVLRRIKFIYRKERVSEIKEHLRSLEGDEYARAREDYLNRFRSRMYQLSHFMRELKLRFSKYYNDKSDRTGTLWEERFRCSLIEGHSNALMNTAAYIELNPVRAEIVKDPVEYRWCSCTESLAGGKSARQGIIMLASGQNTPLSFRDAIKRYREFYINKSQKQKGSRPGMDEESTTMSMIDSIHIRSRYFIDGVILGSREFIEEWYKRNRDSLCPTRRQISHRISSLPERDIHTYRKVS